MRLVGKLQHLLIAPAVAVCDHAIKGIRVVLRLAHAAHLLSAITVGTIDLARYHAALFLDTSAQ